MIAVPQYVRLSVKALLAFAANYTEVLRCLPIVQKEVKHLPRAYIDNIIHSIVGKPFKDWVKSRCDDRHEKLVKKRCGFRKSLAGTRSRDCSLSAGSHRPGEALGICGGGL